MTPLNAFDVATEGSELPLSPECGAPWTYASLEQEATKASRCLTISGPLQDSQLRLDLT